MIRCQKKHLQAILILIQTTGWQHKADRPRLDSVKISASRWAFPLRPDGGRKDCKVSRVVEMEWASRVTVTRTVARSLDRRTVDLARQASTHAAITHPKREVAIQAGPGPTLKHSTHGHLLLTCQARRPPRWAPRHVPSLADISPPVALKAEVPAKAQHRGPRLPRIAAGPAVASTAAGWQRSICCW